jgi:hypothetical protein
MSTQQPPTKKIKMFSSESLVNAIPFEVWRDVICTKLGYSDRLNLNATCNEFNDTFLDYKQKFLKKHAIHVPQDVRTIEKAMELVAKTVDPTEKDPLRIVLDKGVHEISESDYPGNDSDSDDEFVADYYKKLHITRSHITFVGKGKDQTTILGGVDVRNQQNVNFEELAITNPKEDRFGLFFGGTTANVLKCAVKECGHSGMSVYGGSTVTATQCEFMNNGADGVDCHGKNTKAILNDCTMHHNGTGLLAYFHAVVDVHGPKTDIAKNIEGIYADCRGKVNIHLPSQHNTIHDNVERDRVQENPVYAGPNGSIANINDDGTFTHVE